MARRRGGIYGRGTVRLSAQASPFRLPTAAQVPNDRRAMTADQRLPGRVCSPHVSVQVFPQFNGMAFKLSSTPTFKLSRTAEAGDPPLGLLVALAATSSTETGSAHDKENIQSGKYR